MSDWLMTAGRTNAATPRFRVIAMPHAGGWPTAYNSWKGLLPPDVELVTARLPGRVPRLAEAPVNRLDVLVEHLSAAVRGLPPLPEVVVGHSFGCVLAYELTRDLERHGRTPALLAVSARSAPSLPHEQASAHLLGDDDLVAHMAKIGGISQDLAGARDLLAPAMGGIRADLEINGTYTGPADGTGTAVPILALGGADDPLVSPERMAVWDRETTGGFTQVTLPGGHFYLFEQGQAESVVERLLAAFGPARAR